MKPNRLVGHELPQEGTIYDDLGRRRSQGKARCTCGVESPEELPGNNARKRWHREHKDEIRRQSASTEFPPRSAAGDAGGQ